MIRSAGIPALMIWFRLPESRSMTQIDNVKNPHQGQPIRMAGAALESARAAMLMLHGRGARAEDILALAQFFPYPGFAHMAP